jgi:hypothetical protein
LQQHSEVNNCSAVRCQQRRDCCLPLPLCMTPHSPDGCLAGACAQDSTAGGLRCQQCADDLLLDTATGECCELHARHVLHCCRCSSSPVSIAAHTPFQCLQETEHAVVAYRTALGLTWLVTAACPAGRYSVNGTQTCVDCPKGSWCPGGPFRPSAQPPVLPAAVPCPPHMTTLGMRSTSDGACGTYRAAHVLLRVKPGQTHSNAPKCAQQQSSTHTRLRHPAVCSCTARAPDTPRLASARDCCVGQSTSQAFTTP